MQLPRAKQRVADNDLIGNRLFKGENLLALKALEAEFAGEVRYVDTHPLIEILTTSCS